MHINLPSSFLYKIKIYGNIILHVVLYGCETWSITLTEERRLRVFEISVLSIIFGTLKDEVTKGWIQQHSEELNELNSPHKNVRVFKLRRIRLAGKVACMGKSIVYNVYFGTPEGRRPHGIHRRRLEDYIKMDPQNV
jgi:hypothetical protein